jgi:hypothetical protein
MKKQAKRNLKLVRVIKNIVRYKHATFKRIARPLALYVDKILLI